MTPLMYAAVYGHLEIAEALADAGAELDLQTSDGSTALHLAAANNKPTVVRLLVSRGTNQTIKDDFGRTAREDAVKFGNTESADLLR